MEMITITLKQFAKMTNVRFIPVEIEGIPSMALLAAENMEHAILVWNDFPKAKNSGVVVFTKKLYGFSKQFKTVCLCSFKKGVRKSGCAYNPSTDVSNLVRKVAETALRNGIDTVMTRIKQPDFSHSIKGRKVLFKEVMYSKGRGYIEIEIGGDK